MAETYQTDSGEAASETKAAALSTSLGPASKSLLNWCELIENKSHPGNGKAPTLHSVPQFAGPNIAACSTSLPDDEAAG